MNIYENPMSGIDMGSSNPPSRGPVETTPETSPSQLRRSRPARHWSAQRQALVRRKGCRGTHRRFGNLYALVMVKCYLIWIGKPGKRLNFWSAFHSFIISVYGGEMCWQSWPALPLLPLLFLNESRLNFWTVLPVLTVLLARPLGSPCFSEFPCVCLGASPIFWTTRIWGQFHLFPITLRPT